MSLLNQKHPKIITKNKDGHPNGWLVPIFNVHDGVVEGAHGNGGRAVKDFFFLDTDLPRWRSLIGENGCKQT